ncbi:hypothetical protein UFOVP240_60 [uncultured Caudovirales phage]|uniref:Uncharacterized protein n=1 Tax=uncultured Caudovirales phage TaxID=2100421 RepID=A0A6J7WSM6_9CAUD|nr:hypothetical protein UFOVP240_60 [uncultured Caudovirales phage]
MDMSQAATFLGASILISIGVIIIAILLLILNNLFSMFWKPVKMMRFYDPYQHQKEYEQNEPLMDKVEPTLEAPVTPPKPTMKKR